MSAKFKTCCQTITYLPHFISQVVICGLLLNFLSYDGMINQIIAIFGGQKTIFMQNSRYFRTVYVASGIWQGVGYGSIIYLSALYAVDPQLLDAAAIDGCNRFGRVFHVTLPSLLPQLLLC